MVNLPIVTEGVHAAAHPFSSVTFPDVAGESSLHKILRKRDGNIPNELHWKDLISFLNSPFIILPFCASTQWQDLVSPCPSPRLPSLPPRLNSSWPSWAEPRGTFGIAANRTCSSGSCSSCTWDLMSRCVVSDPGEFRFSVLFKANRNHKSMQNFSTKHIWHKKFNMAFFSPRLQTVQILWVKNLFPHPNAAGFNWMFTEDKENNLALKNVCNDEIYYQNWSIRCWNTPW